MSMYMATQLEIEFIQELLEDMQADPLSVISTFDADITQALEILESLQQYDTEEVVKTIEEKETNNE